MTVLPIMLRPAEPTDLNYIMKSWIESYRNAPSCKDMVPQDYYKQQQQICTTILADSPVTIACLEEDPDTICGFICHDKTRENVSIVHYVYVKRLFGNDGIADQLFQSINPTTPTLCSHINSVFEAMRTKLHLVTPRDYHALCKVDQNNPQQAYLNSRRKRDQ